MPELPEVETIRNSLRLGNLDRQPVVGLRILTAQLFWERSLVTPDPVEFAARIAGQRIVEVGRRGKFLIFTLDLDALLIHLRMSGDIRVEPASEALAPHDRMALDLEGGLRLAFNDPRKFGRIWLVADPAEVTTGLGPEPLDPALTAEIFHHRLAEKRRQLKPLLLDQTFLAGLGNIYADEALNLAQLHPLATSDRLTPEQSSRLLESIRQVLEEGIRRQGASIDWVYRGGDFQNYFRVYQRTGLPCPRCGTPIERINVGQRGTHFCPHCQQSL